MTGGRRFWNVHIDRWRESDLPASLRRQFMDYSLIPNAPTHAGNGGNSNAARPGQVM